MYITRTIDWAHTKLTDEFEVQEDGNTRVILTFEGEKPFTLMQQPIQSDEKQYSCISGTRRI